MGRSLSCGFPGKEWARQGKKAKHGLVRVISAGSGAGGLPLAVHLVLWWSGQRDFSPKRP